MLLLSYTFYPYWFSSLDVDPVLHLLFRGKPHTTAAQPGQYPKTHSSPHNLRLENGTSSSGPSPQAQILSRGRYDSIQLHQRLVPSEQIREYSAQPHQPV